MQRIATAAEKMLRNRLLPFWEAPRDETYGGYYGYMDFDHRLDKGAEKGCVLNSRILWFFSEAAGTLGDASLVPYARHAYGFLRERCREYGGVYWSLDCGGEPLDTAKHTYNQAFAIYALSAYYRLTEEGGRRWRWPWGCFASLRRSAGTRADIWRRSPGTFARPPTKSSRRTASWRSGP